MSLTWAGVSSDSLGVRVERYPDLNRPQRKMDIFAVPGRNGDLILPQDAWENYSQIYEIFAGDGTKGDAPDAFVDVAAWLYAPKGYQRLEDSYEPDIYRLAYYQGGLDVANSISRYGRASVQFNCRPERFLKTGETELSYTPNYSNFNSITLTNPTQFPAKPILKVTALGTTETTAAYIVIWPDGINPNSQDAYLIWFDTPFSGTMYIDTQSLNCYDANGNNMNSYVQFVDGGQTSYKFPELLPGVSYLSARYADENDPNTMITSVGIIPNWWTL